MKLSDFATEASPLHASAIPDLIRCNLRSALIVVNVESRDSGKAADTGSAVHKAVAEWHRNNRDLAAAIRAMRKEVSDYPLADLADAEKHFRLYAADPENAVELALCEEKVSFELDPAETDPTGQPIVVAARLDQVRVDGATLKLWDVKHSSETDAWRLANGYAYQLAAYCHGAALKLGRPVEPGGFIRTRAYAARKHTTVFIEAAWTSAHVPAFLDGIRRAVARVRAGQVDPSPGSVCDFCPWMGLHNCIPEFQRKVAA